MDVRILIEEAKRKNGGKLPPMPWLADYVEEMNEKHSELDRKIEKENSLKNGADNK